MPASKSARRPAVTLDSEEDLRVECYVRSTVPGAIAETIGAIVERLQRLCDHGLLADYQVTQWLPERHATFKSDNNCHSTRHDLVAEFERWADQHGYTLEPAFRREEIPSSPLGLGTTEPRERLRVPLVALAFYEDNTETETLRGVIPYTERSHTGEEQTYTVDEWLSTVETTNRDDFPHSAALKSQL